MSGKEPSDETSGRATTIAIGNFDGVHRGHQELVRYAVAKAQRSGFDAVVLTFDPHPAAVLGKIPPPLLTATERKVQLLQEIDPRLRVVVQKFDKEFSQLSDREFVETVLLRRMHARQVVVGSNFHFGSNRQGNPRVLAELGRELGFDAQPFELSGDLSGIFSSTRVREAITAGDLSSAAEILGRWHALSGRVVRGDGRGHELGFPTANLEEIAELLPPPGIYACLADPLGPFGSSTLPLEAVVHLGPRPAVNRGFSVEVHILDGDYALYNRCLRVHLVARIRGVSDFASLEQLRDQIGSDVASARRILGRHGVASKVVR